MTTTTRAGLPAQNPFRSPRTSAAPSRRSRVPPIRTAADPGAGRGSRGLRRVLLGAGVAVACLAAAGCGSVSRAPTVPAQPPPSSVILHGAGGDNSFPIYEEVGSQLATQG